MITDAQIESYLAGTSRKRPTKDALAIYLAKTTGYSVEFLREFLEEPA